MAGIGEWTEAQLRRFIASTTKASPATLPRSLKLEQLEVERKLVISDEVAASPQALEYLHRPRLFLASWQEMVPTTLDNVVTWAVPTLGGRTLTFALSRAFFRIEAVEAGDVLVRIERSPGGGLFVPTTVVNLTVSAGQNEVSVESAFGSISSGDLLRTNWITPGTLADNPYILQLEGVQQ